MNNMLIIDEFASKSKFIITYKQIMNNEYFIKFVNNEFDLLWNCICDKF